MSTPGTVRVMIVDDHRIVREGLRQVLADYEGITVVADAAHGGEAMQWLRASPGGVDAVLLDIALPGRRVTSTRAPTRTTSWRGCARRQGAGVT